MEHLDSRSDMGKLSRIFESLAGYAVLRVVAGGAAGSIIGIYFARKAEGAIEGKHECYMAVECSWRLDGQGGPITSSCDENSESGPMLHGLLSLRGNVVSNVLVKEPGYDLLISFSEGYQLSIFCDVVREGCCWYLLGPENVNVSVEPAGKLRISEH